MAFWTLVGLGYVAFIGLVWWAPEYFRKGP